MANKPVVGVSYWEAEAFAQWAGGRLPSEHEWEAAARGPEGRAYPWGDPWEAGICNSGESQLGETSPVGIFPRSRSPFGLEDMAGNVWEWCSDGIRRLEPGEPGRRLGERRRALPGGLPQQGRAVGSGDVDLGFRLAEGSVLASLAR